MFSKLTPGEAVISVVTYGELRFGVEKSAFSGAVALLNRFVDLVPVLPMPVSAGDHYGAQRKRLEAAGEMIGGNDLWIAAHALADKLTLVTNNEREFRRIDALNIENWIA